MNCCTPPGLEQQFDQRSVQAKLAAYRRNGPDRSTQVLIDALHTFSVHGRTLLDIGGGVGAIQHSLLEAGARNAVSVDASGAYVAAAREESARRGYLDRTQHVHADFVAIANTLAIFDIVTLDRVVCCYADMPTLISRSVGHTQQMYALVLPRSVWWMQLARRVINGLSALQRSQYRFFIHKLSAIDALLTAQQFEQVYQASSGVWLVCLYARADAGVV